MLRRVRVRISTFNSPRDRRYIQHLPLASELHSTILMSCAMLVSSHFGQSYTIYRQSIAYIPTLLLRPAWTSTRLELMMNVQNLFDRGVLVLKVPGRLVTRIQEREIE